MPVTRFLAKIEVQKADTLKAKVMSAQPGLSSEELLKVIESAQENQGVQCYTIYLGRELHHVTVVSPRWTMRFLVTYMRSVLRSRKFDKHSVIETSHMCEETVCLLDGGVIRLNVVSICTNVLVGLA